MVKETTIKVCNEFKASLRERKLEGEDFEQTLIRLIKGDSIPQEKEIEYTAQEQGWEDISTETSDAFGKQIIIKKLPNS